MQQFCNIDDYNIINISAHIFNKGLKRRAAEVKVCVMFLINKLTPERVPTGYSADWNLHLNLITKFIVNFDIYL